MSSYPIQRPEGPVPGESLMARFRHVEVIEVSIWGRRIGAVAADPGLKAYVFEYDPQWVRTGIQLAPLTLPIAAGGRHSFTFPDLDEPTFRAGPPCLQGAAGRGRQHQPGPEPAHLRGDLGGRCARQGRHWLESGHRRHDRQAVRPTRGLRALAAQVRRHRQRPGARPEPAIWPHRVRLFAHGHRCRRDHAAMPLAQSLRSSRSRAPHPPWSGSTVRSGAGPSLAPRLA